MKKLLISSFSALCILLMGTSFAPIADNPDAIVGVWKTGEGNAMVRIYKNGEKYQGKIVWLKEPNDPETGKPKQDKNHPDEANRTRPVLGLVNIWGFSFKENNTEVTVINAINRIARTFISMAKTPSFAAKMFYVPVNSFNSTSGG